MVRDNIFLHRTTHVLTDRGIKKISQLKRNDRMLVVDELGYVSFVRPSIDYTDNFGVYYHLESDLYKLKIGINKTMYISDSFRYKVTAEEFATTLMRTKVKVPANAYEHKRIGINFSDDSIRLYALSKLKKSMFIDGHIRIAASTEKKEQFLDELIQRANFTYYNKYIGSKKIYYIKYFADEDKFMSVDVVEKMNAHQANVFIDVVMLFDRSSKGAYKVDGITCLCERFNAMQLITLFVKAGYRCHTGNNFRYEYGIDSITVKKAICWELNVFSMKLSQSVLEDINIRFPVDYKGFFVIENGYVFIIPNQIN